MKLQTIKNSGLLLLVLTVMFLLTSCGNKITQKNADKIELEMSINEVIEILGEANDKTSLAGKYVVYTWYEGASSTAEAVELVAEGKEIFTITVNFQITDTGVYEVSSKTTETLKK